MSIGCYSDMIQDLHCKLESNRLANQIFPKALSTRRIKTNNAKASRMSITNVKQGCRWRVRRLLLQLFLIQTYLAIPQVYFYFNCFIIHCKICIACIICMRYFIFKANGILYHQSPHNNPTRSVLYGDFLDLPRPIKLSFRHPLARSYGVLTENPAENGNNRHYKLEEPSYRSLPSIHTGRWTGLEQLGIKLS